MPSPCFDPFLPGKSLLALLALALAASAAFASPPDPSTFIFELYGCTKDRCDKPEDRYEKHLTAETAKLSQKVEKADGASGEACIDWDVQNATNAGMRPARIEVRQVPPAAGETRTAVEVALAFGRGAKAKERLTYYLVQEGGRWAIDDIGYDNPCCGRETLVQDLKACR